MIRRDATYDDRAVVLLLEDGNLALRLKKAENFITPKIPLDRDELYEFEFDVRMRYGPESTTPRLVAGEVAIESHEPRKVRVTLKGKPFIEGPLDPLLFAIRAQLANWNGWEMRQSRRSLTDSCPPASL